MNQLVRCFAVLVVFVGIISFTLQANATLIVNGDFETGDLTGWTWEPSHERMKGVN